MSARPAEPADPIEHQQMLQNLSLRYKHWHEAQNVRRFTRTQLQNLIPKYPRLSAGSPSAFRCWIPSPHDGPLWAVGRQTKNGQSPNTCSSCARSCDTCSPLNMYSKPSCYSIHQSSTMQVAAVAWVRAF